MREKFIITDLGRKLSLNQKNAFLVMTQGQPQGSTAALFSLIQPY